MEKLEVKPFVDIEVKDFIYKWSFVTGYSVKGICEDLFENALSKGLISELSLYFKRDITLNGITYKGNRKAKKFNPISINNERISMTLNVKNHDYAYDLSCAIKCSIAKVVTYAVQKSMSDYEFLEQYVNQFLDESLTENRKNLLLDVVETVNKKNNTEEYNIASLLLYIADEYRRFDDGVEGVLKDAVGDIRYPI